MALTQNGHADTRPTDPAERYRQAAEVALQQLEWTIRYLERIRKTEIARALADNHASIRRRMTDRSQ